MLRNRGGTWIGWPGSAGSAREFGPALAAAGSAAGYDLVSVPLDDGEVREFYHGFSNEVIWPLFHDLPSLCNFDPAYWRTYCKVNRKYAAAVAARADKGDFVWVHDYHLMNVGADMRALATQARLGFFLHIPFPSPDVFLKLPWRRQVVQALLQYDLVGFQAARDRRNFLACIEALGEEARIEGRGTVVTATTARGDTRIGSFPISIDYNSFMRAAATPEVDAKARELHTLLPKRKLVLGIDRLDYTKGITLRLQAFQDLLVRHPDMRGKVSLIQVVVPSREDIPEYHRMKTEIEQLVGRINGEFARPGGWVPVWYEYRSLTRLELLAYYRAADIALITPLKDGMNLVAKEYCACSIEEDCVLILSEFAGAAEQLRNGALLVNPHDIEARGRGDPHRALDAAGRAPRAHAHHAPLDPPPGRVLLGRFLPACGDRPRPERLPRAAIPRAAAALEPAAVLTMDAQPSSRGTLVVTGGGRGIGAATAALAAQRGYAVCVNYLRDAQAASKVVAGIEAAGGKAVAVQGDVASESDVVRLFDRAAQLGPITALVNNAGILELQGRLEGMSAERLARVFATNITGVVPVRARSGAAHVHAPWRTRRRHRQCVLDGGAPRRAWRVHRLRSVQGRHRHAHHRARARGGRGRHPRERRAAGCNTYRHPRERG